jgi:hypothetical protein
MARLRSDQQKETDDCHYVVTLSTQIFLDATFAKTASRGTSFVGMAEGDLSQRDRARRCSCAPTLCGREQYTLTYGNAITEGIESGLTC